MGLYPGLPLTFGIQIPAALKPMLTVKVAAEAPKTPGTSFPGGSVLDEIQFDLEAVGQDWIWLEAKSKE
jgi:hypothetical protein